MKRTPLVRHTPLRATQRLARGRTPRVAGQRTTEAAKSRQDTLRRVAYALVGRRSGGWCEAYVADHGCSERATQHHHRRPRRMGGSLDPTTETAANIVHVCDVHHDAVEANRANALRLGWLLHANQDPASVPILLWHGWVILDELGTSTPDTGAAS